MIYIIRVERAVVAALAALLVSSVAVGQQTESTDFTTRSFTAEQLVEALNLPIRGIAARCVPHQQEMTRLMRGISSTPRTAEEVPALNVLKSASVTATFHLDSAELTDESRTRLGEMARALNSPELSVQCFQLAGHTCDLGEGGYNMGLSMARAEAVKSFLVSLGVEPGRLVTTGFGETSPLVPNTTEMMRERNRRVDLGALVPVGIQ
jgi:outer membrane protein OmpA-like peptidoglycan-associated protein